MSAAQASMSIAIVNVGVAFAIGFGLFKLIKVNGKTVFPDENGRNWLAWAVSFSTLVALPKFFRLWDADSFVVWLLALVVFGGIAYVLGLIIGRLSQKKPSEYSNERAFSDPEEEAIYAQVATEIDNGEIHQGLWLKATTDSDGSEFQAKAFYAKFRVNQLKREAEEARKEQIRAQERERKKQHMRQKRQELVWRIIVLLFIIVVGYMLFGKSNSAEEHFNRGYMYYEGEGVEQDIAEAVNWWHKAAVQGHAGAQNNLGVMYDQGEGVEQNSAEALRWWRKAAEQGEAYAQNSLGEMYDYGRGIEQNKTEAVKWYRKSAEQENAAAQFILGVMYESGEEVEQDYAEALKWYRKAAAQGVVEVLNPLGVMYELGKGVEKNYTEAVKWYRKAADADNETGQTNLALMYAKGWGVPQDDVKAAELFLSAANKGDSSAQFNLGLMTAKGRGVQKDIEQAINLYRQAAEQDHIVAQIYLAISDRDGLGMDKNESEKWFEAARKQKNVKLAENKRNVIPGGIESPPFMDNEALDWLRKAMEDETGMAYHRLSLMFKFGRGVIPDANEAEKWSRIATKQGYKTHK